MVVSGQDALSIEAQRNATVTSSALLRAMLASKRVLKEYRQVPPLPLLPLLLLCAVVNEYRHVLPPLPLVVQHVCTPPPPRPLSRAASNPPTHPRPRRLDERAFNWLVGEVETRFVQALANLGEAVGTVAAQSIGEPTTQVSAPPPPPGRTRADDPEHLSYSL